MSEQGWKVVTHDLRPPIQGGAPLWTEGALPVELPAVVVDQSNDDCGAGWNYTATLAEAVAITKLFRDGQPVRAFAVTAPADRLIRETKRRAATLTVLREAAVEEWREAFATLSIRWFSPEHAARMADEQIAWWVALRRPERDEQAVIAGLTAALAARDLPWALRRFDSPDDARDAWDAWDTWAARDARDAWAAWAAWDAWDAWEAICTTYAALRGWITAAPERHTLGIRDAYTAGLAVALPTGPNELGWAMAE